MTSGVVIPGSSSRDLLGKDPKVFNIPIVQNVEGSYTFPSNIRRVLLKVRNSSKLQVAFTPTESASIFFTLHPGAVFEQENLDQSFTIYFQASQADVVEILTWSRI